VTNKGIFAVQCVARASIDIFVVMTAPQCAVCCLCSAGTRGTCVKMMAGGAARRMFGWKPISVSTWPWVYPREWFGAGGWFLDFNGWQEILVWGFPLGRALLVP
jgi:hypothetical protein